MKKIDKTNILSKNYEEWLASIGDNHPTYNSSKFEYYNDIKMSLLHCQNALCAYTEELLCDKSLITTENWDKEKYITELSNQNLINGDLEHFDATLKKSKAWLWDNLFFVNSNINSKVKCSKAIQMILKPDGKDYDEYKYLEFDYKKNLFTANENLSTEKKDDIDCMIRTLGINANAFKRQNQINRLVKAFENEIELDKPVEYITSWNMTLKQLQESKKI